MIEDTSNLSLVYVRPIGKTVHDMYEYEFFFSETPDIVWGLDWNEQCPGACGDLTPDATTYTHIVRLTSIIPFFCAQENTCFSLQDCIDGVLAIAFEDISEYEEYPEPLRLIFHFGESYDSVEDKLARRHQFFGVNTEDTKETEKENEE